MNSRSLRSRPLADNEAERLDELRALEVLDTPQERSFDGIVEIAAELLDAPMAAVTLVDEDRQWFKAETGIGCEETDLDVSFCSHTILGKDTMVVEDATQDARFRDNPLVTGPVGIRFYVGVPLRTLKGLCVGALCVLDVRPRKIAPRVLRLLERLAALAVDALEAGRRRKR